MPLKSAILPERVRPKRGIWNSHQALEVIGNIHENPELLNEAKELAGYWKTQSLLTNIKPGWWKRV
jgi:hypothetical protein